MVLEGAMQIPKERSNQSSYPALMLMDYTNKQNDTHTLAVTNGSLIELKVCAPR